MTELSTEAELLTRCQGIEALSFQHLATSLGLSLPATALQRKGWLGQAVELALGATAGNKARPDFEGLGIELKTLPINHLGKAAESTFISTIPLLTLHQQVFADSQCYAKLKRVLWLPVEGSRDIPFAARRIGRGFLWSPTPEQVAILERDWTEFALLIGTGRLAEIDARMGDYLQVRPKAANGRSLCYAYDELGEKMMTLPRGFYLRAGFTSTLLSESH